MIKKIENLEEDNTKPSWKIDIYKIIDISLVILVICVILWTIDKLTGGKLGL